MNRRKTLHFILDITSLKIIINKFYLLFNMNKNFAVIRKLDNNWPPEIYDIKLFSIYMFG